ncbi:ubiquinone biosynthesis monooxygenase Coq7 [Blastomyces gilchristii SLH14081]|uniref:5-demethoxyubiquinone hydroxylase, mitochondrial n=1 Tax=Blastomyces gilchristii (strain SLH14081) TaxID=559298 RepID=A0A179UNB9_BLAGS|nr:ubiquinone biosynthesis monooxygenase Coq7 [Blastomyces gilchristii SLH14081]OAT09333.1 ubiquinone biosynthesis monooxygenase Coq7 [Blastomyces gilchristii SLH14081]
MDLIPAIRQSLSVCRPSLRAPTHHPIYVVPRLLAQHQHHQQARRNISTTSDTSRNVHSSNGGHAETTTSSGSHRPKRRMVLTQKQRDFLDSALRVNQAGELAATLIYAAQTPPVTRSHPHLRPLMKHMYDQEAGHLTTFNDLVAKHRVRPTAMYPIWEVAATTLGWATGIMGREAAMACTEAVETEIGTHYNDQVREILGWFEDARERGEEPDEELVELVDTLRRIRDEELEHLDHAVENDAKDARPYDPLVNVIRLGCRAAIQISQRV